MRTATANWKPAFYTLATSLWTESWRLSS